MQPKNCETITSLMVMVVHTSSHCRNKTMKHLIVGAAVSGALLAGLIACTANNPVIATDLAAVVADIQTDAAISCCRF